jgi:hypothetical protein
MTKTSLPHKRRMAEGINYVIDSLRQIDPDEIENVSMVAEELGRTENTDRSRNLVTSHVFLTITVEMKERLIDDIDATVNARPNRRA